jgi:putative protease
LISSEKDLRLCKKTSAEICFQIPDSPLSQLSELTTLFRNNRNLTPWFPSVLIGKDYRAALIFLKEVFPKQIVTDNSGIAFEAFKMGIPWIAGPRLNIVNSYGLLCLKERFNCSGAYLSNEINRQQIKGVKVPENFKLFYSLYHPIDLMTSRQCLFQQVSGCAKQSLDEKCIPECNKSASISNESKGTLFLKKTEDSYNRIYNETNYLNTDIVTEVPDLFTGFLIDLRDVKTSTKVEGDFTLTIERFKDLLKDGSVDGSKAAQKLRQLIQPTTNSQYKLGI